jgi:hypothetical protein
MPSRKRALRKRFRVGRVSLYLHHGAWWLYYRDGGQPVRRRVAQTPKEAEQVAAQVNAQLAQSAPTLLAFAPIGLPELRQEFFNYHEYVLRSSLGTIRRYERASDENTASATRLARRSWTAWEVRSGCPTRNRFKACSTGKTPGPINPIRGHLSSDAHFPRNLRAMIPIAGR